jgi:hypothetical protein
MARSRPSAESHRRAKRHSRLDLLRRMVSNGDRTPEPGPSPRLCGCLSRRVSRRRGYAVQPASQRTAAEAGEACEAFADRPNQRQRSPSRWPLRRSCWPTRSPSRREPAASRAWSGVSGPEVPRGSVAPRYASSLHQRIRSPEPPRQSDASARPTDEALATRDPAHRLTARCPRLHRAPPPTSGGALVRA